MDNEERLKALKAAAIWDFDLWLYETWESHNQKYFNSDLQVGFIFWGITAYGHTLAYYSEWQNTIVLHKSLVEPSETWRGGIRGRERIASDVLLHEMIHQAIFQQFGHDGCDPKKGHVSTCSSHNNQYWVYEVNRIAQLVGLLANAGEIRQRRVDGKVTWYAADGYMTRQELARWPYSVREKGYYLNIPNELESNLK